MLLSPDEQGYTLPTNLHPTDSVCFNVPVPNDPAYIQAFIGALYDTTLWLSWQKDANHKAIEAAKVMKNVWWQVINHPAVCGLPGVSSRIYEDINDMTGFRLDCNCNLFVECCDGTEKQILTADQVKALIQGQPGAGAPQPTPNGGSACYTGQFQASGAFLVPTPVSTGDVLTLDVSGAGLDNSLGTVWRCPDGEQFFGNACVGFPVLEPSDPIPAINHMRIIYKIGASYYDAMAGPFTVPGGVVGQQVLLQVNDSNLADDYGTYTVSVCRQNNQTSTWSHDLDFTAGAQGFVSGTLPGLITLAQFVPGSGWEQVYTLSNDPAAGTTPRFTFLRIQRTWATATTLTEAAMTYDQVPGTHVLDDDTHILYWNGNAFTSLADQAPANATNQVLSWSGAQSALGIALWGTQYDAGNGGFGDGTQRIFHLHVEGTGPDPFV